MAVHWVDTAFEKWGAMSSFSKEGLLHLDAMRHESLAAQVRDVLDFVNACQVSQDDWEKYRECVAELTREWSEPLLEWGETSGPGASRLRLRPEPPDLPT